jgi:hypothetical protein
VNREEQKEEEKKQREEKKRDPKRALIVDQSEMVDLLKQSDIVKNQTKADRKETKTGKIVNQILKERKNLKP